MTTLRTRAPEAAAFAPFGTLIHPPAEIGTRQFYSEWCAPVAGLRPQLHTNRVAPSDWPVTVTRVERHPHAAQAFMPMRGGPYLVVTMPSLADGQPDGRAAQAWLVPPDLGVIYRAGVWHAGITAIDLEASFAVLMWRGATDDDVFVDIPPIIVTD